MIFLKELLDLFLSSEIIHLKTKRMTKVKKDKD